MADAGTVTIKVRLDFSAFRTVAEVDIYATLANILAEHMDWEGRRTLLHQAATALSEKYTILPGNGDA